jgi:hypothetical protein
MEHMPSRGVNSHSDTQKTYTIYTQMKQEINLKTSVKLSKYKLIYQKLFTNVILLDIIHRPAAI